MKRLLLTLAIGTLSLTACAQPPAGQAAAKTAGFAAAAGTAAANNDDSDPANARVREALKKINPNLQVGYVGPSALPGFREVIVGGQTAYVSDDGKYLVQGNVVDLAAGRDIGETSAGLASYRKAQLESVPESQRIVFAPANPKYVISVFTDITCGYCRKLHSQIADYNAQGIAVEYLAYPRTGLNSPDAQAMANVWCADNPKQALTDAKMDKPVPQKTCANPVADEYKLGERVGVSGTPAIFTAQGVQIGGYLPPDQMRAVLDKLAGAAKSGG